MTTVIVTKDCENDDGFRFWQGEVFEAMSGGSDEGIEIKAFGDYTFIPAGHYAKVEGT